MKKLDYTYLLTKEIIEGNRIVPSWNDEKLIMLPRPVAMVLLGGCLLYQFPRMSDKRLILEKHTI